ncbi:MAG: methyltransferase domain-containing protein [Bacteroidetes bacterium]|nr:methyltransferase domain-containing protein [Bacteroidota bacterium]
MENKKFENELDAAFWNQRWASGQTGWDIGYASPPITNFMEQYKNKNAAILIPGCGNAYEAGYLATNGFTNITLVDISSEAVERLKNKFINQPQVKIFCGDFFQHQGKYDLIIEQTFFCAQVIERRNEYAQQMAALLNEGGQLTGVLFGVNFENPGPPFGGDKEEYQKIFEPYFQIKKMEDCYNSIPPRAGNELFINFIKK